MTRSKTPRGIEPEAIGSDEEAEAKSSAALPPRVVLRPDPAQWSADELMTLMEAAALFWPMGPLTTTSLRTAVRDRQLDVAEIAGKILTNKESILKLCRCSERKATTLPDIETVACDPGTGMPRSVAEYRRMVAEGRL